MKKYNFLFLSLVKYFLCIAVLLIQPISDTFSQTNSSKSIRSKIDLTGKGWKVWMDKDAPWKNDSLYLPNEFELSNIPVNPPSCGWKNLNNLGTPCNVPFSIEEIFSKWMNNWKYYGVSWVWRTFSIPKDWKGKIVKLNIGKARLRVEIYINEQLAGYDIVAETPIEIDISKFLNYGKKNKIAIRLTNPGGNRGWEDYPNISWGKYKLPPSHDFSGVDGKVSLSALNKIHIQDIFVKNILPVNVKKIEVITTLNNPEKKEIPLNFNVKIYSFQSGKSIYNESWEEKLSQNKKISKIIIAENAQFWNIDSPNLYYCEVSVLSGSELIDIHTVKFDIHLINEGKIEAGKAILKLKIKDGKGNYVYDLLEKGIEVEGGDTYAQKIFDDVEIIMKEEWNAGHITIEAKLYRNNYLW